MLLILISSSDIVWFKNSPSLPSYQLECETQNYLRARANRDRSNWNQLFGSLRVHGMKRTFFFWSKAMDKVLISFSKHKSITKQWPRKEKQQTSRSPLGTSEAFLAHASLLPATLLHRLLPEPPLPYPVPPPPRRSRRRPRPSHWQGHGPTHSCTRRLRLGVCPSRQHPEHRLRSAHGVDECFVGCLIAGVGLLEDCCDFVEGSSDGGEGAAGWRVGG